MKKSIVTLTIFAALLLSLSGCGSVQPAASPAPTAAPQTAADGQAPAEEAAPAPSENDGQAAPSEATAAPVRQDGERFEDVIMLEGMEETVRCEHIRNETAGFEMDYDYESFLRRSDAERECFLSLWDDPENPENYLEVSCATASAELQATAISAILSGEYEVIREDCDLGRAGSCIRLEAFHLKGTNQIAQQLQEIYIIPASDGCRIGTAHFSSEAAEGFGRRFSWMMQTLTVLDRVGVEPLSDEQALSAVVKYCTLNDPDLEEIVNAGEFPAYWEIVSSDAQQVVILFRSYTGAQVRYYVDRALGDVTVMEFVPGIMTEESPTDESFSVWDYLF